MSTNEEKKSWHSQIFNNWVTVGTGLLVAVAMLTGWAHGILAVPDDIRELKENAKTFSTVTSMTALETRVNILENDNVKNRELLIRMDERLKSIQDRLGVNQDHGK